ncbi:MAG: polyprenyl synthetase family protein [Proteobacteria bacterium]|nr:polyprenyl synthetase family protein [Pseudomonadota bacterium]
MKFNNTESYLSQNFDLESYFAAKANIIKNELAKIINNSNVSGHLLKAMKYSLMSEGKRIRPVLCIASAESAGGKETDVLPAACAIEIIHTYSLIHDDLPAIDNDVLRRGKPTCHAAFNEATAILAGDALLTLAFQVLSSVELQNSSNALKWLKIIHSISTAAGYMGMIEGQMRDIASENSQISLNELEELHSLKTGELIIASVESGAILANASSDQITQLNIYANKIGLAFQIADDLLNVKGDPTITGKPVGTDNARKKSTYPSLLGIVESENYAKKLIKEALHALALFDNKSDPLRAIALYIIERKR